MAFTDDEIVEYVTETNSVNAEIGSDEGTDEMVEKITLQEITFVFGATRYRF